MKLIAVIAGAGVLWITAPADAKLQIVATTPDFAAIARAIGGERVEVTSLAKGIQDPHFVDAKPSFIRLLNQADVLIEGGADLEVGWLPPVLESARNPKLAAGAPGRVAASAGVRLLQPATPVDRSEGDVHPLGNPHYMLDPENSRAVADGIAAALCRLDAAGCGGYRANVAAWDQRLDQKLKEWTASMAPYRGVKVITYHDSWPYFARRFGLEIVDHVEPKPGIPPTPGHLEQLVDRITREQVRVVIMEPYFSDRAPQLLAHKTGVAVLALAPSVAPEAGIPDYFALFDQDIARLVDALKRSPAERR